MSEEEVLIKSLRTRIHHLNTETKEKDKLIKELKQRCTRQSDEIVLLKAKLFKEGYYDNNRSKQRN